MTSGLESQPYAASSRKSVIARYQEIIDQGFERNLVLPRSGPWAHRIVNQRKTLPVYRGRYRPESAHEIWPCHQGHLGRPAQGVKKGEI